MLRSTTDTSRLYLTAELLAVEGLPIQKKSNGLCPRCEAIPPVEDVVSVLTDRLAAFA